MTDLGLSGAQQPQGDEQKTQRLSAWAFIKNQMAAYSSARGLRTELKKAGYMVERPYTYAGYDWLVTGRDGPVMSYTMKKGKIEFDLWAADGDNIKIDTKAQEIAERYGTRSRPGD